MDTFLCSTDKDPAKRGEPSKVSSTYMRGRWSYHAYSIGHDGKTTIIYTADGIKILRPGRPAADVPMYLPYNPRDFMWAPDSRRVAFWAAAQVEGKDVRGLAVMDTGRISQSIAKGDKAPYDIVYAVPGHRQPYGVEWSPSGDAVFVLEVDYDPASGGGAYGVLWRVEPSPGSKPKQLIRMKGAFDFFMPPVSRFERGEGPSGAPYRIILGHGEGLFLVDPHGKGVTKLSEIPAVGLQNIEWNPDPRREEVALFFRRPVANAKGETFGGVWLVDIKKAEQAATRRLTAGAPESAAPPAPEADLPDQAPEAPSEDRSFAEELYDGLDIHTLWYSPRGTYVTWASLNGVWFRRPAGKVDTTVHIAAPESDAGVPLDIKGVTWADDESKLAYTAGNRVYVYEVAPRESYKVAEVGTAETVFLAEPRFVGQQVYFSAFEDASPRMKPDEPELAMPGEKLPDNNMPLPDNTLEGRLKREEQERGDKRQGAPAPAASEAQPPQPPPGQPPRRGR